MNERGWVQGASRPTGADVAAATLVTLGVETVFCLPGEETIALLEAIDEAGIELVVARHEQHAAFMAATNGRLTGRPGVLVTTLGPGVTNATTGLAHATLGGFPLVHLAGQKPLRDNWEGSFQVVDLVAATQPVTVSARRVTDPLEVSASIAAAWSSAMSGRPGAAFLEIPTDVARGEIDDLDAVRVVHVGASHHVASADAVAQAVDRLDRARRPVIVAAGGAQQGEVPDALAATAERLNVPVVALQTGVGSIPSDHPCAMPAIGMHSPDAAHLTLGESDLAVVVGYDPAEHPPLAWNRDRLPVIHVAAWPATIERGYSPVVELVGDPAMSLEAVGEMARRLDAGCISELRAAIAEQLAAEPLRHRDAAPAPIDVIDALSSVLSDDDVVALDNGSYKLWFARHFAVNRPNGLLLDNALATMGAGLAIATSAALLEPDRRVVAVVGDGGFLMNVGDLETAVRLGVENLTVLVLRDDAYGFIADHQRERDRRRVAVDLGNPDLVMLARAFGATGARVEPGDDLQTVFLEAIERPGLVVIDCPLDERADELLHATASLEGATDRFGGC